jgi:hypothetical protein
VAQESGKAFRSGELAAEYGFTDVYGRRVAPFEVPGSELVRLTHATPRPYM